MSDVGMILQRIGATLATEVAPKLEGDYAGGHAGMAGIMAVMAGEMWDKEADLLVSEIARLRGLLGTAGLGSDVPETASFRISDLKATRNALAEQLITLQSRLEDRDDDEARGLNEKIWGHLLATSAARMPSPPEFGAPSEDVSYPQSSGEGGWTRPPS